MKIFLSVINKNKNWEILTKNLVTFKRWDTYLYFANNFKDIKGQI